MKKVLITGISKGIGRALAQELALRGCEVSGTCRHPESVQDKIPGVRYIALDLRIQDSIISCAGQAGEVDILINNAGQSMLGSAEETSPADYRDMFQVNFFGMVQLTSLLLPKMRNRGKGRIINIGSLIASFPIGFQACYASTKAAAQAYTYSLHMEIQPMGLQAALIEPSDVRTTIKPLMIIPEGSPYATNAMAVRETIRRGISAGRAPEHAAAAIADIALSPKLKLYYSIGFKSKMLLFCKRLASPAFVNKNVSKQYGIRNLA
jgi:short-subunit dehydrogenase